MTTPDPYADALALIKWWGNLSEPVSPEDAVYNAFYGSADNAAVQPAAADEGFLVQLEAVDDQALGQPLTEGEYTSLFPPSGRQ